MTSRFRFLRLALLGLVLPLLSTCYLPEQFTAEIRVSSAGEYVLAFDGILTWVPLYADANWDKLSDKQKGARSRPSAEDIALQEKQFNADLARDSSFKEVQTLGQGRYRVSYEKKGQFHKSGLVTFVRRNAVVLSLKATKDHRLVIQGTYIGKDKKDLLQSLGLPMRGLLRVVTAAEVLEHNAQRVRDFQGYKVYDWGVDYSNQQSPKLVLKTNF